MASSRTQSSPGACSTLLTAGASPLTEVPRQGGVPVSRGGLPADGGLPLCGGTANRGRVVRVGDTVVRPTAPCWPATHALLRHLDSVGFDGAPRVLSAGPATETLTYIAGRAAVPPLPDDVLTDEALVSVADLLRRYHRAAASRARRCRSHHRRARPASGATARQWSAKPACPAAAASVTIA